MPASLPAIKSPKDPHGLSQLDDAIAALTITPSS